MTSWRNDSLQCERVIFDLLQNTKQTQQPVSFIKNRCCVFHDKCEQDTLELKRHFSFVDSLILNMSHLLHGDMINSYRYCSERLEAGELCDCV